MLIVSTISGIGWEPVTYMVSLAAELFDADLLLLENQMPSSWEKLNSLFLRRQKSQSNEVCLFIVKSPTCLLSLLLIKNWRKRFRYIAAWIIDSFWVDWIPKIAQLSQWFDHLFVTTEEDIPEWKRLMKTPTTFLPWGTDALRLGGKEPKRIYDLLRVGRQPSEWENDSITEQLCLERNLCFHGRPKILNEASKNQEMLMDLYRQTKFLLAFSNSVNPAKHTHPLREYLTARWVDALACGAVVAGIPPKSSSITHLLWDGATLDIGSVKIKDGLQIITDAVHNWRANQAESNYCQALERLDWRWRFAIIADFCQESPKRLNDELQLLRQRIEQCKYT